MFEVKCPCCQAMLKIDPSTQAVIHHQEAPKPPVIEDLAAAAAKLKAEAARRGEVFEKAFAAHQSQAEIRDKKFEELLKQAKADPDAPPPTRDLDWD